MILSKIRNCKNLSGVIRILNNNKTLLIEIINETNFLDKNVSLYERLFNIKNNIKIISICPICKKNKLEWDSKYKKYKKSCSDKKCKYSYMDIDKNPEEKKRREKISKTQKNKSKEEKNKIIQKIKKTNFEKYGVDSFAKTSEFKDFMLDNYGYLSPFELKKTHNKSKQTLLDKYGVDHNFKIDEVKLKKEKTFKKKYGVDNPTKSKLIKDKIKKTNNIKYGGNSPMCNKDVIDKARKTYQQNYLNNIDNMLELIKKRENTMFKKYGVKYWVQNSENLDKINKNTSYKEYYFNDKKIYLQGYEDYVLFEILLKKYDINDIYIFNADIEKNIGKINYLCDNKKHKYYPDFYIKSVNKIYEVKSDYTYESDILKNKLKQKACLENNINFEFIIINKQTYKKWININKNKN